MTGDRPTDVSARREMHSRTTPSGRAFWWTDRLWGEAVDLEPREVSIDSIAEFDLDCWFGPSLPATCRAVAEHARRIQQADLSHPVILSASGALMDGGHRVARAWLEGQTHIAADQFSVDPEPDWVE